MKGRGAFEIRGKMKCRIEREEKGNGKGENLGEVKGKVGER